MKVPYSELLVRNAGPESYADRGNAVGVVSAGAQRGAPIELRKQSLSECPHHRGCGRQHGRSRYWRDDVRFGGVEERLQAPNTGTGRSHKHVGSTSVSGTDVGPKTPLYRAQVYDTISLLPRRLL